MGMKIIPQKYNLKFKKVNNRIVFDKCPACNKKARYIGIRFKVDPGVSGGGPGVICYDQIGNLTYLYSCEHCGNIIVGMRVPTS